MLAFSKNDYMELIKMSLLGRTVEKGKKGFISTHAEPRGDNINIRFPVSLDQAMRDAVGWTLVEGNDEDAKLRKQYNNAKLRKFIESAVKAALDSSEVQGDNAAETVTSTSELSPLVLDAINDSLEKKRIAIARERKLKKPDQNLIEQWEAEIEELERFL